MAEEGNAREGLRPRQRPVTPSSDKMALSVLANVVDFSASCCLVAMTETGIVKIWPRAPASAPSTNSVLLQRKWQVDDGEQARERTAC